MRSGGFNGPQKQIKILRCEPNELDSQKRPTKESYVWRFEKLLRKVEYLRNCRTNIFARINYVIALSIPSRKYL
jgi:hypothetical protein